jgi:hypothetical protein
MKYKAENGSEIQMILAKFARLGKRRWGVPEALLDRMTKTYRNPAIILKIETMKTCPIIPLP